MTMTYDTLNGAKGSAGAIATWVNYSKLDTPTIIDEAQTLIYQTLRVREMRSSVQFTVTLGQFNAPLPNAGTGQFLEPLLLRDITNGITLIPNDERYVSYEKLNEIRVYSGGNPTSGTPGHVAIYDELFNFDFAASGSITYELVYYLRPALLATGSPQNANFLTARYPHILRTACMASAADFMKDTEEYNKLVQRLGQLIEAVNKGPDVIGQGTGALINADPAKEASLLSMVPTTTAPVDAVFLEAQALVYSRLRVREMRVSQTLTLNNGFNSVALPGASTGQFLEVVTLHDDTNSVLLIPNDVNYVSEQRLLTLRSGTQGIPTRVAIFNEAFQFDVPAQFITNYTCVFYQRPANLANRDASNFLTLRYPQILRTANQAALADYQGNSDEHQKCLARLDALCQVANAESAAQDAKAISSELTKPGIDSTLLNFIADAQVPVQAILIEAQALAYSRLRVREMRVSTPLTLTSGFNTIALPGAATGQFLEPIALYDSSGTITFIPNDQRYVSQQRLLQIQGSAIGSGTPQYVSIFNENLNFDVNASGNINFTLVYFQRPANLTNQNSTNFLTLRYPHILRAAAQVALADFKHDTPARTAALQVLDALCKEANDEANLLDGKVSDLNQPAVEGSLLNLIGSTTTPVAAVLLETQALVYSKLRVREMRFTTTLALTNGLNSIALPGASTGDFLEPIALQDTTNGASLIPNDERFVSERRLLQLRTAVSGVPLHVSIFGEAFQFDVPSNGTTNYTLVYYGRSPFLTTQDQSNWLTLRYPQIFRAAAEVAKANMKHDAVARDAAMKTLDALVDLANNESNLLDTRGTRSDLTVPTVEASLLQFIPDNTVPAQSILTEAQALVYTRLRVREMRVSTSLTLLINTNTIALPGAATGDFLEPIALYDATGTVTFIPSDKHYVSQQRLLQQIGGSIGTGVPTYVAIYNEALNFDVQASPAQTFTLVFYKRPAFLTSPNSSNFLTQRYPHILRAAAQVAIADFKRDTAARTAALGVLDALCKEANDEAKLLDGGLSPLNQPNVEGTLLNLIPTTGTPVASVLAETQALIYSKLRVREMRQSTTLSLQNANSIVLPGSATGDFLEPIALQDTSNSVALIPNDERFVSERRLLQLRTAATTAPQHVSIFGEAFQFDTSPSALTNYTLVYYQRPVFLTTQDQSNFLTLRYPQIFRAGAEVAAANMRHDAVARDAAMKTLDALIEIANKEAALVDVRGTNSTDLTIPTVESTLLNFIADSTVPAQAIISEAQALIYSKLRVREMRQSTTLSLTIGQNSAALPGANLGNFLEVISLHDDTDSIGLIPDDERFVSEQRLIRLRTATQGIPQHVSIFNEAFQFDAPANGTINYTCVFYQRPAFLTSPNASNFLTLRYPQIFRAGAQVALANFKHDLKMRADATAILDALIDGANKEAELIHTRGTWQPDLTSPIVEGSLLSFISDTSVPAQAILFEAQSLAYSKLRVREMRQSATFSLTIGQNSAALPGAALGNFLEVIALHDDTDAIALVPDDERFVSEQRLLRLRTATQGIPQHVSIFNEAFQFDAPANGTINYTTIFYQRPAFLTTPSSSNFLTLRYPQIFRAAIQVALATFKRDLAAKQTALAELDALVDVANKEAMLIATRGTQSDLTIPQIEGSLLSFIADSTVPARAILAEAQAIAYSKLRVREMRQSTTLSLTTGLNSIALPGSATGDFLEPIALHDDTNSVVMIPNDERFVSEERLLSVRTAVSGAPQHVSIFGESFQFDAPSNGTTNYTLVYYQRPAFLTNPTGSNWFSLRYPQIFRASIQLALANFKRDLEAKKAALTELDALIDVANKEAMLPETRGTKADINQPGVDASLLSFFADATVPAQAILAEAQVLIFSKLRAREMLTSTTLSLTNGNSSLLLPGGGSTGTFLEVVALHDDTNARHLIPNDAAYVSEQKLLGLRVYTGGVLGSGIPAYVSVFNEAFQFDVQATGGPFSYTCVFYQRPALLTSPNSTNFLSVRYPAILRTGIQAALADFKRDSAAHEAALKRLNELIDLANAEVAALAAKGTNPDLNKAPIDSSLTNFIADNQAPVQAILNEAQALIYSKLRVREMRQSTTLSLPNSTNNIALPGASLGNFLEVITLHDDTNGVALIPSDERFVSEQRLLQLRTATLGPPQHVSIFNEAFQFDSPSSGTTNYSTVFYQRPAFLTNQNSTNFLSQRYPQILRAGAHAALAAFKRDEAGRQQAMQTLDALIDVANKEAVLVTTRGTQSELTGPTVEATLVNFIPEGTVAVQAILSEAQAITYSKLRVREMRVSTTLSLTTGVNNIPLPGAASGNFLEPITLHDDTNSVALIPNDERFLSEQRLLQVRTAVNGTPSRVSIFNEAFQFDVPSSGTTNYTLVYYQRPAFLTEPSQSNFLTQRYPQILRAAAQVALANFKHDAAARTAAMQTLDALVDVANKEADLVTARGTKSTDLTAPTLEATLINFIPEGTVAAQAIISEAQALIYSKLRVREMRQSTTFSLTTGLNNVTLPGSALGNFLEPITLHDDTDSIALIPSDERFVSEQRLLQLRTATQGVPQHVSIFNEAFQFDAPSNGTINYTLVYFQRPAFLTEPSSSNFLTLRYPQIFRAGAQVALANFKHDAAARTAATQTLDALIDVANKEADLVLTRGTKSTELTLPTWEASLLSFVPDATTPAQAIILEAQALVFQRLRVREMRVSTPLTLAQNSNTIALPGASTGQFLEPIALYDATGTVTFIPNDQRFVSQQRLLQLQGSALGTGTPQYVSIYNENLVFDVNASVAQSFTLVSYQRPANLTSENSSNFLTFRYPQILRTAALVALAGFKRDIKARTEALEVLDALCQEANAEAALLDSEVSALNKPLVEGSLLSLIPTLSTPVQQVFIEGQQLLYGILRCREMMTEISFTMPVNSSYIALPARFLDPIGPIQTTSFNSRIRHKDSNWVQSNRNYTETTGTLGTNPFTTVSGSFSVTVNLPTHGFSQDSVFETSGATAFNGVTINGTFPVSGIVDANNFTIDITSLGTAPTGSGAGGGSAIIYLADVLTPGTPYWFAIWNERINFEQAFFQQTICKLQYYQSLPLLTTQDQSNFLTTRYPQLLRIAMQAAEANMKRDRAGYETIMGELTSLVMAVNAENDMQYRGLELDPWIP